MPSRSFLATPQKSAIQRWTQSAPLSNPSSWWIAIPTPDNPLKKIRGYLKVLYFSKIKHQTGTFWMVTASQLLKKTPRSSGGLGVRRGGRWFTSSWPGRMRDAVMPWWDTVVVGGSWVDGFSQQQKEWKHVETLNISWKLIEDLRIDIFPTCILSFCWDLAVFSISNYSDVLNNNSWMDMKFFGGKQKLLEFHRVRRLQWKSRIGNPVDAKGCIWYEKSKGNLGWNGWKWGFYHRCFLGMVSFCQELC